MKTQADANFIVYSPDGSIEEITVDCLGSVNTLVQLFYLGQEKSHILQQYIGSYSRGKQVSVQTAIEAFSLCN